MSSHKMNFLAGSATVALLAMVSSAAAQTPVTQSTNNSGTVSNSGTINSGIIQGPGASAAISATGAVSAVSVSGINTSLPAPVNGFGAVSQSATNTGNVTNVNPSAVDIDGGGNAIAGPGASASITATGALASFSVAGIGSGTWTTPAVTSITQAVSNNAAVANSGSPTIGNFTSLSADGTSASVGASGAAASVGFSFIGDGPANSGGNIGAISQTASNLAFGTTTNTDAEIALTGGLIGAGSSASISATGAIASVSASHIGNDNGEANLNIASISQGASNAASVTNDGVISAPGGLQGIASSAVISATGAAASVSSSSIGGTSTPGTPTIGPITQSASNTNAVSNSGTITVGGVAGAGAAASISAVGAGAYASFSAVK